MVCSAKITEEYELNNSQEIIFNKLKESIPKTKIFRFQPPITNIDEDEKIIDCITPGYKTKVRVLGISENKTKIIFSLKPIAPLQIIDLWNRNKKNIKAIMNQLTNDLNEK